MHTIVFDFGNVIGYFDHRQALRRLAAHTDRAEEDLFRVYYESDLEDAYERGQLSTAAFLAAALELGGLRCGAGEFLAAYCDIFTPNETIRSLIPRLKPAYRLLLASNTTAAHSDHFREQFRETLAHFDVLCLSHEAGARKPETAFWDYCQARAGCPRHEVVFIDDLEANVLGAERYGWNGIVYNDAVDLERHLRDLGVTLADR
jgi:putative hydrolase of the HAD superfamily